MAAISGINGKILVGASQLVECNGWTLNRSAVLHAYSSCATGGYKKRVAGVKDSSGSLKGLFDPDNFIDDYFGIGDSVTLNLYVNSSDYYIVPSLIESLDIETDQDEGALVPWSATYGGNGAVSSSGL